MRFAIPSLPHLENEQQWSVNNSWSCIFGKLGGDRLQIVINGILAASIGKRECETLHASSWKWVSMDCQRLLAFHHGWSQRDIACMMYIDHFECFCTLEDLRNLSDTSVNVISCYCPRGCDGNVPYISVNKGSRIPMYRSSWACASHVAEDAGSKIVRALLTLIFRMS